MSGAQCRLCLNRMLNMRNIILDPQSRDFELTIPESISAFFSVQIDTNDSYSKMVCANCLSLIHLIHMHRSKFLSTQKLLEPIIKQEIDDGKDEDDGPPTLQPYFQPSGTNRIDVVTIPCSSLDRERSSNLMKNTTAPFEYIRVPMDYFRKSNKPAIVISVEDERLAKLALYGDETKSKSKGKREKLKKRYLKHYYNKGRPGAIRDLIQDLARQNLYVSDLDSDNKLKSVYEYDFNLRPKELEYDNQLWTVNTQSDVFVCSMCNKVYYSKMKLSIHHKSHKQYQKKMEIFSVIF